MVLYINVVQIAFKRHKGNKLETEYFKMGGEGDMVVKEFYEE